MMTAKRVVPVLFAIASIAKGISAHTVPAAVSDREYVLYAAWINLYFNAESEPLHLADQTFGFDPLLIGCDKDPALDMSLIAPLRQLGKARFPIDVKRFYRPESRIVVKFDEIDSSPKDRSQPPHFVSFSRAVFNEDATKAFFGWSDSCGSLCGRGGSLMATRRAGKWTFDARHGCSWFY